MAKFDCLFIKAHNSDNIAVTSNILIGHPQPWQVFYYVILQLITVKVVNFLFTFLPKGNYTYRTTLPLQGYSVNFCLGRKDRLNGGFFISGIGKAA